MPARAATDAENLDAIIGTWDWFNGAAVTMNADGSMSGQSKQGEVTGKWKLIDPARRQYKLLWRVNGKATGMDTVTLSADGQALSGQDSESKAVNGKRNGDDTPPIITGGTGTTGTSAGWPPGLAELDFNLKLGVRDGKLVIITVVGNPLAAAMKLKVGDRVLSIGGKSTEGMSAEQAQALMKGSADTAPTVEILRSADNTRVKFTAPRLGSGRTASGGDGGSTTGGITITGPIDIFEKHTTDTGSGTGDTGTGGNTRPVVPEVSEANRKQAEQFFEKGVRFGMQEKWLLAEAEYRRALRLDPGHEDAWLMLGEACYEQKKWPEAVVAYRELVKLAPDSASNHADLARALLRAGKRDEAIKEAREAMRLGEEEHPVYEELGLVPDN